MGQMTLLTSNALTYSGDRPVPVREVSTRGDRAGEDNIAFIHILKENTMSQPLTLQAANHRSPMRVGQVLFTILALLAFALGALLLSSIWFGVGSIIPVGKFPGAEPSARGFLFVIVWPVTMLVVWVCSTIALLLGKRWILASVSLPAAFAILFGVWALVAFFLLTTSAVMFTAVFILLTTGAIWLASWFLKSTSR